MERSLAKLVEVGTTNKTHLRDYADAITESTGLLMKIHTSNFVIEGFTQSVENEELVALGKERNLPVVEDLGSGALYDPLQFGMQGEPLVKNSLNAGLDALCFSGDKLVGGAQAGIVIGKKDAVKAIRANPLYRALRVGKLTLAAMEATIQLYLKQDEPGLAMPIGQMMGAEIEGLETRGKSLQAAIREAQPALTVELKETQAQPGSGSLPGQNFPSRALAVGSAVLSADMLAGRLRQFSTPIFTRIHEGHVYLDLRTIQVNEDITVVEAFQQVDALRSIFEL